MPIIEVNHLTKEYRLGALQGLKQTLLNTGARLIGRKVEERPLFKALDDVNFSIDQGEVVGIIGGNGAGKSTLLKMLARISTPTSGSVKVNGRIAPLIEVGAGFVPDFTGRENIYLNGAILGMSKQEIDRKFHDIVDFAEMAEFIDTPVKRYSSGMQVKLAFAVATSIEAEILIVDEVLAVGDVAFQRKCLGRMEKMINEQGRTVLIVGHNIRQLERICTRMILLKHGKVECDGEPGKVSKQFLDETTLRPEHGIESAGLRPSVDTGDIEVKSIEVITDEHVGGTPLCRLFSDLHVRLRLVVPHPLSKVEINLGLHNPEMVFMTKSSTLLAGQNFDLEAGTHTLDVIIERMSLCPGTYGIGLGIFDWTRRPLWAGNRLGWIAVEAPTKLIALLPQSTLTYLPTRWTLIDSEAGSEAPIPQTLAAP
jgi:ABC-type polysaccharide/polyol phosphate transport system ATPase subunit